MQLRSACSGLTARSRTLSFALESIEVDFLRFDDRLGARGNIELAQNFRDVRFNRTRPAKTALRRSDELV